MVHDRRLEAREREIPAVVGHRPGEPDCGRIAVDRQPVDHRPTGVTEIHEPGDLVERLTSCIVKGRTEHAVTKVIFHHDQHRVPATHEQNDQRHLEIGLFEKRGIEMGLEMVHRNERHVPHERHRLGRRHADEQGADEARAVGRSNGIDLAILEAGLNDRLGDHRHDRLDMGTAGDLRYDPAITLMDLDLARHDRRHDVGPSPHDGSRRLVTAGLDAEDAVGGHEGAPSEIGRSSAATRSSRSVISGESRSWSHMMTASSVGRS